MTRSISTASRLIPERRTILSASKTTTQRLYLFEFRVDWNDLAASTFGLGGLPNVALPIAPFSIICPATRCRLLKKSELRSSDLNLTAKSRAGIRDRLARPQTPTSETRS